MTKEQIDNLPEDDLLAAMRSAGIAPEFSMYASIRDTPGELEAISADLRASDVARWRRELATHFLA